MQHVNSKAQLQTYITRLGDSTLVLGQRLCEIVTGGPELEEELANANLALDYLGQARMFYSYAGEVEGAGRTEDDFAFLRDPPEFQNALLVEQPNGHFGDTVVRQVLFDSYYLLLLEALVDCADKKLADIAARAVKEIRYHLRHASQWLIRLGDGTEESHQRVQESLNRLWRCTSELFDGDGVDDLLRDEFDGPDLQRLRIEWQRNISALLQTATLTMPPDQWMLGGGREGKHTEHFGYLVAEMQVMQRAHSGASW